MSTPLSHIRPLLDSHELLSMDEFLASPLTGNVWIDRDPNSHQAKVYYLHYLAVLGRIGPLRAYLNSLASDPDLLASIINNHQEYDFWYGTPLHTAVDWNNQQEVVDVLIEFGADPTITNYYKETPGQSLDSYMLPPFQFEFSLRDHTNDGSEDGEEGEGGEFGEVQERTHYYKRSEEDFGEINRYVQDIIRDYQPEGGPSMSAADV
jgi:hypothetical protein